RTSPPARRQGCRTPSLSDSASRSQPLRIRKFRHLGLQRGARPTDNRYHPPDRGTPPHLRPSGGDPHMSRMVAPGRSGHWGRPPLRSALLVLLAGLSAGCAHKRPMPPAGAPSPAGRASAHGSSKASPRAAQASHHPSEFAVVVSPDVAAANVSLPEL